MNSVQIGQKSYEMPPRDGFSIAHFLTVGDIDRSARFYETVFGGRILSGGDSNGAPGYIQIANTWLIVNVGGGPTPDKPSVTLSVPDPDKISSFMHIRVADIQACYELWRSRGAEFITSRRTSTARLSATSATLTVILSKLRKTSRVSLMAKGRGAGPIDDCRSEVASRSWVQNHNQSFFTYRAPFSATERFIKSTANVTKNVNTAAIQKVSKYASEDACC